MAQVDLHLHTVVSDGRLTPSELVVLLAQRGVRFAAITDHDSTDGLSEAFATAQAYPEITLVPGIELSTDIPGNEIHILGYFINPRDRTFQQKLATFRNGREDRAREMVKKLADLGIHVEWDRIQQLAGDGSIGRPHIALAIQEKGYISVFQEAFEKYLGRNGPAYAEREKLTPAEAADLIVQAGGLPVLAHPRDIDNLDENLGKLKEAGLVGMEVYYAQYNPNEIKRLAEIAKHHNLAPCGGSDYHALGNPGEQLPGTMGPPMEVAEHLSMLAQQNSSGRLHL